MSQEEVTVQTSGEERTYQPTISLDRSYVPFIERLAYILRVCFGGLTLGKMASDSDVYKYQVYVVDPWRMEKASIWLTLYDMLNDPLTAAIVDNMRTRWGKFKPFQYLALLPNLAVGLIGVFLPLMAQSYGFSMTAKIGWSLGLGFVSETINALVGGGGYLDNVFTPNPNERTRLLTSSKFVTDIFKRGPELIAVALVDAHDNGLLNMDIIKLYTLMNLVMWIITTIPNVFWVLVSRERVVQSEKPPKPLKSITAVFTNAPLLITTISNHIDTINIGTSETLYFRNVLHNNGFGMIWGIPGSPVSYISYALVPKMRARFSTKTLWFFQRGSIWISEAAFFLVGFLGRRAKLYSNWIVMGCTFAAGNVLEMLFYALKQIISSEIGFEVQDYCEWKNGFRVEATTTAITGYIDKIQGKLLSLFNAWILQKWTGFEAGTALVTNERTKYRLFLMAYGPRLVPDLLSMIPMLFYNITEEKRNQMYSELEERRSAVADAGKAQVGKLDADD